PRGGRTGLNAGTARSGSVMPPLCGDSGAREPEAAGASAEGADINEASRVGVCWGWLKVVRGAVLCGSELADRSRDPVSGAARVVAFASVATFAARSRWPL